MCVQVRISHSKLSVKTFDVQNKHLYSKLLWKISFGWSLQSKAITAIYSAQFYWDQTMSNGQWVWCWQKCSTSLHWNTVIQTSKRTTATWSTHLFNGENLIKSQKLAFHVHFWFYQYLNDGTDTEKVNVREKVWEWLPTAKRIKKNRTLRTSIFPFSFSLSIFLALCHWKVHSIYLVLFAFLIVVTKVDWVEFRYFTYDWSTYTVILATNTTHQYIYLQMNEKYICDTNE